MAKIAVLIVAVLALQAAFAKVKPLKDVELDQTITQIQTVANDLTLAYQTGVTNNWQMVKTLNWECQQLSMFLDDLINKMQVGAPKTYGTKAKSSETKTTKAVDQMIAEFRDIQTALRQATTYTDVTYATQLKTLINTNIQTVVEQLVKLAHVVDADVEAKTQGSINFVFKTLLNDFYTMLQKFHYQMRFTMQGEIAPSQMTMRIQEITMRLTAALKNNFYNAQIKMALREFAQNIQMILSKLQRQTTMMGTMEMNNFLQQISMKFNHLLLTVTRFTDVAALENVDMIKMQLVQEFQMVAEDLARFYQFFQVGTQQTFFQTILNDYYYAMQQIMMHVQGMDQTFYRGDVYDQSPRFTPYDQTVYPSGLYEKTARFTPYDQTFYPSGLYEKTARFTPYEQTMYPGGAYDKTPRYTPYDQTMMYQQGKTPFVNPFYPTMNQDKYFEQTPRFTPYDQSMYQQKPTFTSFDRQGSLFGQNFYGNEDQYLGNYKLGMSAFGEKNMAKFGPTGKGMGIQIQVVASEFAQTLETVYVNNAFVKQALMELVREYTHELQMIVDRLHQVATYETGMEANTIQEVYENLTRIIMSLKKMTMTETTMVGEQMKYQLRTHIFNVAAEFQKLTAQFEMYPTKGPFYNATKTVLVQFLIATRNFQVQIQDLSEVPQRDQPTTGFGVKIQTVANDLTAALQGLSFDNMQVREILAVQGREFVHFIETVIEKLSMDTAYTTSEIPKKVVHNLREMLMTLRQAISAQDFTDALKLKMHLIVCVQDSAAELQKLLWIGDMQGQNPKMMEILYDFVALLKNHHSQLQTVYQTTQYGQNTQQLAIQIQAITNNMAYFVQNVPFKTEIAKQNLHMYIRQWAKYVEIIAHRLENEVIYTTGKTTKVYQIVENLKEILMTVQQFTMEYDNVYTMHTELEVMFQKVAVECKHLAWMAQYDFDQTQGNLNTVVRSVLVQYLIVLQRMQMELRGINQTVYVGQTPRELALQIQIVARRLSGILHAVVPDNKQTQYALIWQTHAFAQMIENVIERLTIENTKGMEKMNVIEQIIYKLNEIRMTLRHATTTIEVTGIEQMKIQLAMTIEDASVEIQKLMWVAQEQQVNTFIKGVMLDFLAGLQNLHLQIQNNIQIVFGEQSPKSLAIQIESVASRLFAYFQWIQMQPEKQELRQMLIIQIGQFTQTIENIVQMLQNEIKISGDDTKVLHQVVAKFTKLSFTLQHMTGTEAKVTVDELCAQLTMHIQNIVVDIQKLAWIAESKLNVQVGSTHGALHGVLNNFLATLRSMLIQLHNTHQFGSFGYNTTMLANQIQTATNKLATIFQNVMTGTKMVKQGLAIQIFKYANRLHRIVERLETEAKYNVEFDTLREIVQHLKQYTVILEQIAGTWTTKTVMELRDQFNNQIQTVNAEFQKLLMVQTTIQQHQGVVDTVVKSVLIEYLAIVQNLQIRVQNIFLTSQKTETLQQWAIHMEYIVKDLSMLFQRIYPGNKLVAKTLVVEAREFADILANIAGKLQTVNTPYGIFNEVAKHFKEIQMSLQQIAGAENTMDIHQYRIVFEANVQRAAYVIEQLVWTIQPEFYKNKMDDSLETIVREVLNDFLVAVQNVHLQLENVYQTEEPMHKYIWGMNMQENKGYYGADNKDMRMMMKQNIPFGYQMDQFVPQTGFRKVFGGLVTPQVMLNEIKNLAHEFSTTLRTVMPDNKKTMDIMTLQAHKFAEIVKIVIEKLQEVAYDEVVVKHIVDDLREVQMSLQKLATYNTLTNARQMKIELDNYVQTAVEKIETLCDINEEEIHGDWTVVMKKVLEIFHKGMKMMNYQMKETTTTTQYGFEDQYNKASERMMMDEGYDNYDQFGKRLGYGIDINLNKYGKDMAIQKYGFKDFDRFGKTFGVGINVDKYGQNFGMNKMINFDRFGKNYGFMDTNKYDNAYGFDNMDADKYAFGYDKYGFNKQYNMMNADQTNKYDFDYGTYEQYPKTYGHADQYGYNAETSDVLVKQVRMMVDQLVEQFQTVDVADKEVKQMIFVHAQKLMQFIETIVEKIQMNYTEDVMVREIVMNLKQIQTELKKIVSVGMLFPVYQLKTQYIKYLQMVESEMEKFMAIAQYDMQKTQIAKSMLMQYLEYLRNIYYQFQFQNQNQGYGYEKADDLVYSLQMVCSDLAETLRTAPFDTMKVREFVQQIEQIMTKIESRMTYEKDQEYLTTLFYKLREVLDYIRQGTGVARFNYSIAKEVQQIAEQLKSRMMETAQPLETVQRKVVPVVVVRSFWKPFKTVRFF